MAGAPTGKQVQKLRSDVEAKVINISDFILLSFAVQNKNKIRKVKGFFFFFVFSSELKSNFFFER